MNKKYWFKEWQKTFKLLVTAYWALKGLRDKEQIEEILKEIEEHMEG